MGLIKAITGAAGGVLADSWKEFFMCESLGTDVLMTKGIKSAGGRSSNTSGSDNVITNGSIIAVADGQFMIIVQNGQVVEFSGEPGEFIWDTSTEPSLFTGNLGDSIIETFKNIGKRFTMGGEAGKDQRIYYINTKEIYGNKYGTASPIPFRFVDERAGIDMDLAVRCNGEYSYHIVDPLLFYRCIAGNVSGEFRRSQIDSQLKSELLTALQPAFAAISAQGIRYSELPAHTTELAALLNQVLSVKWREQRGIEVASFGINSVTAPEEDIETIKQMQRTAAYQNANLAAARMADATAEAMVGAAKNENAGAFAAFAGMNMAQNAGGNAAAALFQMAQQGGQVAAAAPQVAPVAAGWSCMRCGTANSGKFCTECGAPKPVQVTCPKCGYVPPAGQSPKFCPECGQPFGTAPQA